MQLRTRRLLWAASILFGSIFVDKITINYGGAREQGIGLALTFFCTGLLVWMLAGFRRIMMEPIPDVTLEEALKTPDGRRELLFNVRTIAMAMRPLVERRYKTKQNLRLLEIGPALTVSVPSALRENIASYTVIDHNSVSLEANRERLAEVGLNDISSHFKADVRAMQMLATETYDIACACYLPFFASGTDEEQIATFKEIHRVLKPGGELIVLPAQNAILATDLAYELYSRFDPVDEETIEDRNGTPQIARVYERKPTL